MDSGAEALRAPVFYYDLGSPECYLAAERVSTALPVLAEWEPVLGDELGIARCAPDALRLERLARERGLLPLRWPPGWPPQSREAMLAATYAKAIGRVVAFSLAAFRQAFAGGRDLEERDTLLIAAAACEMHPTAVLRGIASRSTAAALRRAGARARAAGVQRLPALQVGERVFAGEERLEAAAAALAGQPAARG
jgi:2-hydroxychromene-2-carboxylate isomerase